MSLIKKILLAGACLLTVSGCKKINGPTPDDFISYKVEGVYRSSKPQASYFDGSLIINSEVDGEDIAIFVDGYPTPGIYNLKDTIAICSYSIGGNTYFSLYQEGTLVINSYDDIHISGTFQFKGSSNKGLKSILEGKFNTKVDHLLDPLPGCECPDSANYDDSTYYDISPRAKLIQHLKLIRPKHK